MALNVWTKQSGYSLGTHSERVAVDITLPVDPSITDVTYTVISGKLPPGLRISGDHVVGTPFDVPRVTEFAFCIRASHTSGFADRTFKCTIEGADAPTFVTSEGYLDIGSNHQLYTLDSTFVDYQIEAIDLDIATGQKISYFVADGDGRLPPGLVLTQDGRLTGFVQPTISIKPNDGDGTYDDSFYDAVAYDFAYRPSNGYDSYVYDTVFFDYSLPSTRPKKLNQNYEFIVTITDGDTIAKRKFGIFVVGDDYFRADNTNWLDGSGLFTADVTYLKAPIWSTPSNLGTYRANNYVTVMLDTYDTDGISYILASTTNEWLQQHTYAVNDLILVDPITQKTLICIEAHTSGLTFDTSYWADYGLPPGMSFDTVGGEIYGAIPYQPAISKVYRFIVDAVRYSGEVDVNEYIATPLNEGINVNEIIISKSSFPDISEAINNATGIELTITKTDPSQQDFELGDAIPITSFGSKTSSVLFSNSNINDDVLTVGSVTGTIEIGMMVTGVGVITGTYITENISGSGAGSTWRVSQPQDISLITMRGSYVVELEFASTTPPIVGSYYLVEGSTNTLYNGYYLCTGSTDTTIKLSYRSNPSTWTGGTVTVAKLSTAATTPAAYEVSTINIDPAAFESIDDTNPDQIVLTLNKTLDILTTDTVVTVQFTTPSGETAQSSRMFYLNLIGEVDSVITWVSDNNLGTINANFISTIKLEATSTITNAMMLYSVTSGTLPPGLTLALDGELVGKVRQYGDAVLYRSTWKANRSYNVNDVVVYEGFYYKAIVTITGSSTFNPLQWIEYTFGDTTGLISIDGSKFELDGGLTQFDNIFTFTVKARDQYGFSASEKTFTISIETPNQLVYSNLRTKPFLKLSQRNEWKAFINNTSVFTPDSIYRPNDPSFGVQTELSMLVFAGIETVDAAKYISAMGLNHKRKRFHFGDVKKAIAYQPGTSTPVYEVVYIQMIDPLEPDGKKLPNKISPKIQQPMPITTDTSNSIWDIALTEEALDAYRPEYNVTADSTGYEVSNPNPNEYFPNSISNWRSNIKNWTETVDGEVLTLANERNYLPLWMRSIQPGSRQELNFQLAVPLCYCKVGTADDIILNIKHNGFDFKTLDYTADRYIIDSVEGQTSDKYLVFRNDRITV